MNYVLPFIMIAIGLLHYRKHGMDGWAIIPVILGCFALYMAFFNRPLLKRIETAIIKVWYPVGQLITIVLLTVTFYLIFMPVGLILRLVKKDILNRKFKNDQLSYWIQRPLKQSNYTQQF